MVSGPQVWVSRDRSKLASWDLDCATSRRGFPGACVANTVTFVVGMGFPTHVVPGEQWGSSHKTVPRCQADLDAQLAALRDAHRASMVNSLRSGAKGAAAFVMCGGLGGGGGGQAILSRFFPPFFGWTVDQVP